MYLIPIFFVYYVNDKRYICNILKNRWLNCIKLLLLKCHFLDTDLNEHSVSAQAFNLFLFITAVECENIRRKNKTGFVCVCA